MSNNKTPIIYDFDPRNLPAEYLHAIGLVTAACAQTESVLQDLIGALLEIDNAKTIALTTHMSFPLKNDILRTLAEIEAPDIKELDKLDELLDAVKQALDKRNTIVHNAFAIHPDTREVFSLRAKARGSLQYDLKKIPVQEIEHDAATIYQAGVDIMSFMISRGLSPQLRTTPLRGSVKRGVKARKERNDT
ncbi:MAG: hypothetical protein HND56_10140 [Pseudomonadota bacterium]|nr:hypothetical protein [Pseudomonadota bacterium]QKK06025.1 MAG: hypothetical protein HND56_10140 [Pseudomonadota bacterium]